MRRAQAKRDRVGRPAAAAPEPQSNVHDLFTTAAQHHQSGRLAEAEALYRQVLERDPRHLTTLHNFGFLAQQTGRYGMAEDLTRKAISLNDRIANFHQSLADTLRLQGKLEAAAASYRRAIALKPDFAEAHHNLGNVLIRQGRVAEAAACLRRAVELEPSRAEIWFTLGRALAILGDLDVARAAMSRAVELDPHAEEAVYTLAGLQPMNDGSPGAEAAFGAVSRLAGDLDRLPPEKRPPAMFAMARALESRGEFDSAFAFMAQANAIVRAGLSFDIADDERRMDAFARIFDGPFLERLKDLGSASEAPIFIFGMARSGTTLIEQILSAHPQVHAGGELASLTEAIAAQTHGGSTYSAWAENVSGADCRALAQTYIDSLPPASPGQTRITDKGLGNFEHLGLIHLCLPKATIIHCSRDPRDACLSCYGTLFRQGHKHAFDLAELGRFWRAYDRLMAHWRAVLPPGRMLEVPYENVVEDVEAWARRLIAHCGLEWDDACLSFHETKREIHTASMAQVRRPIYASSVGRWRPFARHLGPLLEALGEPWSDEGPVNLSQGERSSAATPSPLRGGWTARSAGRVGF
jgi:tetratricopeptide (TPR) repeat protein